MSEIKQNSLEDQPSGLVGPVDDDIDRSRRRLTCVGLGVSAILTLASRPVLAAACVSPSAAASGNLSHHGAAPVCSGRTPAQWVAFAQANNQSPNILNNGFPGGNVKFHDVFGSAGRANWGSSTRLYEVMVAGDNGNTTNKPNPISKEFAATLLNIRGGYIPSSVLTEVQLIGMWNDWLADGIYNPVNWDAGQIVSYLQGLQG
jgi:hypothetical protein